MKRDLKKLSVALVLAGLVFTSCKKDKVEENEEEVITTLQLTFVPNGGGTTLVYDYDDPDGPGGTAPSIDEIVLSPLKTYSVSLTLSNKTVTPAEDITTEISDESDAHRFYFEPSAGSNLLISGLDDDLNGVPLGLTSSWTTGPVSTGTVKITLRHYPGNPPNKAIGDLVNSTKSGTDIEVTFNTKIQ